MYPILLFFLEEICTLVLLVRTIVSFLMMKIFLIYIIYKQKEKLSITDSLPGFVPLAYNRPYTIISIFYLINDKIKYKSSSTGKAL